MFESTGFQSQSLHKQSHFFEQLHDANLISWEEVNSLFDSGLIDYPRIRLANASNEYTKSYNGFLRYSYSERGERVARIIPGVLSKALGSGATIILDQCEAFFPQVKALTLAAAAELGCGAWANLYISPKGNSGFGCHFDDHDVLALQIYGEKRWTVHPPTYRAPSRGDKSFHLPPPKSTPLSIEILRAGNALYLPFGYWHNVETLTEISLHVTIGLDFARRSDVMQSLTSSIGEIAFFREKILGTDLASEAEQIKMQLLSAVEDIDILTILGQLKKRPSAKEARCQLPRF